MKSILSCLAIFVIATGIFANEDLKKVEKTFDVENLKTVKINTDRADIYFTGEKRKDVQLIISKFDENKCILETEVFGGVFSIKLENKKKNFTFWNSDGCKANVQISAPRNTVFDVSGASSDIKAVNISKSVNIKTASGDVSLVSILGKVTVKTASGNINVASVENGINIASASGDVKAAKIKGNLKISTVSGDISVNSESDSIVLNSTSGDISVSGIITSLKHKSVSGSLKAVLNKFKGNSKINFKTVSGDVSLIFPKKTTIEERISSLSGDIRVRVKYSDTPDFEIIGKTVSGDVRIGYSH